MPKSGQPRGLRLGGVVATLATILVPIAAAAQSAPADQIDAIEKQIQALQGQLQGLKRELADTKQKLHQSEGETRRAQAQAQQATQAAAQAQSMVQAAPPPRPPLRWLLRRPSRTSCRRKAIGSGLKAPTGRTRST